MNQNDAKDVVVKTVEFPIAFIEAMFNYFDKLDKPFTEKEPFINTFREAFQIAQYKEKLRLDQEKSDNERKMQFEEFAKKVNDANLNPVIEEAKPEFKEEIMGG